MSCGKRQSVVPEIMNPPGFRITPSMTAYVAEREDRA